MGDIICSCTCGAKFRVSEFAIGSKRRCGLCGETFTLRPDVALEVAPPKTVDFRDFGAVSTADQEPLAGDQYCARCKRKFRGEWDRYSSSSGTLCHLCANLTSVQDVEDEAARPAPFVPTPSVYPSLMPKTVEPPVSLSNLSFLERFALFRQTRLFRISLYGLAFIFMALAFYYATSSEEVPSLYTSTKKVEQKQKLADKLDARKNYEAQMAQREQPESPKPSLGPTKRIGFRILGPPEYLSSQERMGIHILVFLIEMILSSVPWFIALVFLEWIWAGGPPGSSWWAGVLYIGGITVMIVLGGMLIPVVGSFVSLIAYFWVLFRLMDQGFGKLFLFFIIKAVATAMMVPISIGLYGLIGIFLF